MRKISAKIGVTALFALALFAFSISQAFAPLGGGGGGGGGQGPTQVNCDAGDTLQAALDSAVEGDTINVSGTCNERITVRIDNVTIVGDGTAIIDGTGIDAPGALLQVRALNVSIQNLTVQNSPRSGIAVARGGSASIQGVTSTGNGNHGISVSRAAFALIGPEGRDHPAAGTGTGNHIFGNTRHGIFVGGGANADIFHNLITGNRRGINISTNGSADIDGNEITGNSQAGIQFFNNGAVRLSDSSNHFDTATNAAEEELENNLIEKNGEGLRCRRGGAAQGNLQNFGVGNPGPEPVGEPPVDPDPTDDHDNDAVIAAGDECHVRSTVFE